MRLLYKVAVVVQAAHANLTAVRLERLAMFFYLIHISGGQRLTDVIHHLHEVVVTEADQEHIIQRLLALNALNGRGNVYLRFNVEFSNTRRLLRLLRAVRQVGVLAGATHLNFRSQDHFL